MRQLDEWERLRAELPSTDAELELRVAADKLPDVVHPLWREVLDAAALDGSIERVVDACSSPDYQVVRAIHDLLLRGVLLAERGVLAEREATRAPGREGASAANLFTPMQLRHIRDWMDAQRTRPGGVLKAVVVPSSLRALYGLLDSLERCTGFRRRRPLPSEARLDDVGTLGELDLGDGLVLRLCSVSPAEPLEPLWGVAAHGSLGAIAVLDPPLDAAGRALAPAARVLRRVSGRPLVPLAIGATPGADTGGHLQSGDEVLDREPVLQLAGASPEARLAVLRNAFSRLVP
jgi:hypothetical protein